MSMIIFPQEVDLEGTLSFIQQVRQMNEPFDIYVTSSGGKIQAIWWMLDELKNKEYNIRILGYASSAALFFVYLSNAKEILLTRDCSFTDHEPKQFDLGCTISPSTIKDEARMHFNTHIDRLKIIDNLLYDIRKKLGYTEEELSLISRGADYYFDADRMMDYLNNKRKIGNEYFANKIKYMMYG